ncbi:lysine exporter LysO family protein [Aeromonas media]|uniref:lysine exporter LysO family protein n=1 Tax=Aeromonas media TaxID=651 RepID=UPI0024C1EDD0|nr:lysine exporter LysO family protein [Aeromonas media]MDM5075545.1 lysine exporter LysO family protein [Aeromonas media]
MPSLPKVFNGKTTSLIHCQVQAGSGIQVVPVAIVSGFILSLLGPILILGFLAI